MRTFNIFLTALVLIGVSACSSNRSSGTLGGSADGAYNGSLNGALSEAELNAQREARFGSGSIPTAEGGSGLFRDIPFNYDSARISDEARQNIEYNVEVLRQNPDINLVLEGHCDERGTAEYNMALGDERASSVLDMLTSYGIGNNRLKTVSYGEELPVNPSHEDYAYAENRRVHFSPFQ